METEEVYTTSLDLTSEELAKNLNDLFDVLKLQRAAVEVYKHDKEYDYMLGLYNGVELAVSTLLGTEPSFVGGAGYSEEVN